MCPVVTYFSILRLMLGDTAVAPAPAAVPDEQLIELMKGAIMLGGIDCVSIVMDEGEWKFSPCPPNSDTAAFIMAHAALLYLGGQNTVSYRTRAISVSVMPQSLEDMRRHARTVVSDIESRGMVCAANGAANHGADMIGICHDYVTHIYANCCGCDDIPCGGDHGRVLGR